MGFSTFSAISFICIDAIIAASTPIVADVAPAIETPVVQAEAAPAETVQENQGLTAPPAEELAPVSTSNQYGEKVASDDYDGPLAFEGESDEAVVKRLTDYLEGIDTLQGDFTQIAPSGAVSEGRFYLRRPGFLRFEYDPPTPLLVVANGGMVYVRDEALETTDSYPAGRTPLKFLLNKKIDWDDAKVVAVDRGIENVAVTFASEKEETEGELSIIVKTPEMTLTRWIVRDLQNGVTIVTLDNVQSGMKLANALFRTPEAGGEFLKN